jgi:hypothetical protein
LPGPGERLWLDEDIEAALEWQAEQEAKCPGCGLPADETMSDDERIDYEAISRKCRACEARDIASHDAQKEAEEAKQRLNGWFWAIKEVSGSG